MLILSPGKNSRSKTNSMFDFEEKIRSQPSPGRARAKVQKQKGTV
jgi:hypothetical protein